MTDRFLAALAWGPMILDAAMGTRLVARGLDLAHDDPALWNLSRPESVAEIHARDVAAGSDAVLTNTFGANRPWLARSGRADQVEAINRRAVALARRAAGPDHFVIGSIGPTAADDPDACREQAEALIEAGVDALLLETQTLKSAASGLRQLRDRGGPPVLVSLYARPCSADPVLALLDLGASALGGNCQPPEALLRLVDQLHARTSAPLLVQPNAGPPGVPPASPESFAGFVPRLLDAGVRLLGGCCGTTEAHVATLRAACYHQT
ncbi:MAG: homocysteine S-methyltransferase family protein [Planctomycetaceae bacterium]|nr:homocysteine S-methyltransferase family protein [Planctomycetaceae bacterium]